MMELMDTLIADIGATVNSSLPTTRGSEIPDKIVSENYRQAFVAHQSNATKAPLLLNGDAIAVLRDLPDGCIDFAMTSPPYWGKREYENGGIGLKKQRCQAAGS